MPESLKLRADSSPILVCFGDSLTAGYQVQAETGMPLPDTPYGGFLQEWLGPRGRSPLREFVVKPRPTWRCDFRATSLTWSLLIP